MANREFKIEERYKSDANNDVGAPQQSVTYVCTTLSHRWKKTDTETRATFVTLNLVILYD